MENKNKVLEEKKIKILYNKNDYTKDHVKGIDLFTGKKIENMTAEEFESSTIKYESAIKDKQENIISTLKETQLISNKIGSELNSNTECITRINDELDELDHRLTTSEYLVKRISSWFSIFKSVKKEKEYQKIEKDTNKTQFFPKTTNLKSNEKRTEDDFYDDVNAILDDLQKNSNVFGQILKENAEDIEHISTKVEKSDIRIKKTTDKVKKI